MNNIKRKNFEILGNVFLVSKFIIFPEIGRNCFKIFKFWT